jgi:hypothetical protein
MIIYGTNLIMRTKYSTDDIEVDIDVTYMDVDDVIEYFGEITLLENIEENKIIDYIDSENFVEMKGIQNILKKFKYEALEYLLSNMKHSDIIDMLDEDIIKQKNREITIDEIS